MWSEAKTTAGHGPAASLRAESASPTVENRLTGFADGAAPLANETLTPDTARGLKKSAVGDDAAVIRYALLNAFFAISVNSPSMSMVNFSCCVCSAPSSSESGVPRRVAPQPTRMAVRTEAGAHARL